MEEFIRRHNLLRPGETVVVGVSGGPDSLCLAHLLLGLRERYPLAVHLAHLHHGIRGAEANADAAFVAEIAHRWKAPLTVERIDVPALAKERHLSVEEAARTARYEFLARVARAVGAETIAVGHNADDQVETVVMHWLRGAGLAGLRGMQPLSPMPGAEESGLRLIRPLLSTYRADIEAYCMEVGITPRFDRSNLDTTLFRNRLRHELLPYLEEYNPNFRELVRRASIVLADDYDYLRAATESAWTNTVLEESETYVVFALAPWRALHPSLQRGLLRSAVQRLRRSLRDVGAVHVENAMEIARLGHTGQRATLPAGLELILDYNQLVIAEAGHEPRPTSGTYIYMGTDSVPVVLPGQTPLPGTPWLLETQLIPRDELVIDPKRNQDSHQAFLDYDAIPTSMMLRRRKPGDRFCPLGLGGHEKSLTEFLIGAKVPRALRDRIPLLVAAEQILWVCGLRPDERAKVKPETRTVLHLRFIRHPMAEESA
ncbi:MAG: tRNA lysidine(34) synthetase TilS [Chloroflexi bacterium]|nr:tRNA lysidine(34) synthetase TilS [Chloroflexota bacterium]